MPVRKLGKLPAATIRASYALEYGTDSLEMHRDAITTGQRVLVVDDLLATGGTASATVQLVKELGGVVVGVAVPDRAGRLERPGETRRRAAPRRPDLLSSCEVK